MPENGSLIHGTVTTADRLHQAADDARRLAASLRKLPNTDGRTMQLAQADDMGDALRDEARAQDQAAYAAIIATGTRI